MKKNIFPKMHIHAFSLAEALITLLIVCIITLASIPVLTKKKRNLDSVPHGQWTCEYNEEGQHISYSQDSPTPVAGDYCEFIPPARATNFTIQAVGGGGGGGAGYSELKLDTLYPGDNRTVDFLANNIYEILLIGAGGGGGGGNDERGGTRGYGGGSGASVYFKFTPQYNISYSIDVGRGGAGGHGDDGGHSAGSGEHGGDTTFGGMVIAGGGRGGEGVQYDRGPRGCLWVGPMGFTKNSFCEEGKSGFEWGPDGKCKRVTGKGCEGKYTMSDPTGNFKMTDTKSKNGNKSDQSTAMTKANYSSLGVTNLLQASASYPKSGSTLSTNKTYLEDNYGGAGGIGGQGKSASGTSGYGGYAAVKADILMAGSAGRPSETRIFPVATIDAKGIKVTLGKGGKGGKNVFTSYSHTMQEPTDGTATVVGDILTATGGEAGENQKIFPDSTTSNFVAGEDGATAGIDTDKGPSYGGRSVDGISAADSNATPALAPGGGGGGGGAKRATGYGATAYSTVYSGDGADGANGKVIIKW